VPKNTPASRKITLTGDIGNGTDGLVLDSYIDTAIKAFFREQAYRNERDSYLRLREFGVLDRIDNFNIPKLLSFDDALFIVEMDIVKPPYIIDFGKVRIDRPPDFSDEVLREHKHECREMFGHHYEEVRELLATLESYQIYYLDPRPSNIMFPDMR
jgi:hypothetical protein